MDENQKRRRPVEVVPQDHESTAVVETARCSKHCQLYVLTEGCNGCVREAAEAALLLKHKARWMPR